MDNWLNIPFDALNENDMLLTIKEGISLLSLSEEKYLNTPTHV